MALFGSWVSGQGVVIEKRDYYTRWWDMVVELESGRREKIKVGSKDGALVTIGDIIRMTYQPGKTKKQVKNIEVVGRA